MRRPSATVVIAAFFLLALCCAALVIVADFLGASIGAKLADVAAEGFKITVAALVGALSATLGARDENK
jgi:hypothetical protein